MEERDHGRRNSRCGMHSLGHTSEPNRAGSTGSGGCFRGLSDSGTKTNQCYMGWTHSAIRLVRPLLVVDWRGGYVILCLRNVLL